MDGAMGCGVPGPLSHSDLSCGMRSFEGVTKIPGVNDPTPSPLAGVAHPKTIKSFVKGVFNFVHSVNKKVHTINKKVNTANNFVHSKKWFVHTANKIVHGDK